MIGHDSSADDAALTVIRASLPGRAWSALIELLHRSWMYSHTRKVTIALATQAVATRIRLLAIMTATAGLVALVLMGFATAAGPFVWIPPAVVLAWSIVVLASTVASR